ncbi:hypothetical protein [Cupriavidus pinatubonensis]|nr:hypothetical protein [Cupriavidus pinatubonensis]
MKQVNFGSSPGFDGDEINAARKLLNEAGFDVVSRIYNESWVLPALELLLPNEEARRDPTLAESLSRPNRSMLVWPRYKA